MGLILKFCQAFSFIFSIVVEKKLLKAFEKSESHRKIFQKFQKACGSLKKFKNLEKTFEKKKLSWKLSKVSFSFKACQNLQKSPPVLSLHSLDFFSAQCSRFLFKNYVAKVGTAKREKHWMEFEAIKSNKSSLAESSLHFTIFFVRKNITSFS